MNEDEEEKCNDKDEQRRGQAERETKVRESARRAYRGSGQTNKEAYMLSARSG